MLTKKYRRIIQGLSLWLLTGSALQALAVDDEFYYRLGGGEPVTRSASNRDTTLELGGAVVWNTDLMCGNFDMSLSVDEQLKGLKGSFSNLMSSVISAATGAVASLPALIIQKVNPALYDLLQNGMIAEDFKDVKVIALHVNAGQAIHTVDKPIHTVEDLKGLKLRIPTRTGGWIIEALGANPVAMPVPELPQALSKKVVDGAFIPWEIIPPLKIHELTKYQIEGENNTRFGTTTFMIAMNKDSYAKLPDDLKAVIDKNAGLDWWKEIGQIWTDSEKPGIKMAVDHGNEHIVIAGAELEKFRTALEPVVNRWVEEVTAKGIDGKALVAAAREAIAKHSKEGM